LGAAVLPYAAGLVRVRTAEAARRLLLASVLYLPALFTVMLLDRQGG
jgi:heme O synthase-like polyprenyltransferase